VDCTLSSSEEGKSLKPFQFPANFSNAPFEYLSIFQVVGLPRFNALRLFECSDLTFSDEQFSSE
jgi:hypothetical protein